MRDRSRARAWALRILYAWEARGAAVPPRAVLEEFLGERNVGATSRDYLVELIRVIDVERDAVDAALAAELTNWRIERLSAVDRNVLRIAAAEMLYIPDVPPRVSIQEAIMLAERYGTDESPRFVNGVLDALMRRIETGGREAR